MTCFVKPLCIIQWCQPEEVGVTIGEAGVTGIPEHLSLVPSMTKTDFMQTRGLKVTLNKQVSMR